MLAGPATTFYDLRPDNGWVLAGLRLPPGAAAAVVGRPVSDFTQHRVDVDSIFGVHGCLMAEKVLAATTPSQRVMALQDVLTGYLADAEPSVDTAVTRAIGIMRRNPGRPVSSLAAAVDLSDSCAAGLRPLLAMAPSGWPDPSIPASAGFDTLRTCFEHFPGDRGSACHLGYGFDPRRGELKVWTMPPVSHDGDIIVKSVAWRREQP